LSIATTALPFAHGGPPLSGRLRAEPADFRVDEVTGIEPSGSGEHAFLIVEKTGANTDWVARRLAAFAGVAPVAVGYSGLKDRHAVTTQAFSVQLPGRADPDWSALGIDGVRVVSATRHDRKLKRGVHRGNRFRIVVRDVSGSRDDAEARIVAIAARGVPNYFGEQRFGRDAANVEKARQLFAGRRMPREQVGFALSSARSFVFNAVLAARVEAATWDRAIDGDVFMLSGSHSIFGPEPITDDIVRRLAEFDIDPTGPMAGAGELRTTGEARAIEQRVVDAHRDLVDGLARAGLAQQRRALRLRAQSFAHEWTGDGSLVVEFLLDAGAFATVLLRELCDYASGGPRPTDGFRIRGVANDGGPRPTLWFRRAKRWDVAQACRESGERHEFRE
jgi:tRNA pseudouridine13 synthase